MRREGYEFQVSAPEVILRQDEDGQTLEPYEEIYLQTPPDTVSAVIGTLDKRRGRMISMVDEADGNVLVTYRIPTRGLLGFRHQFLTLTRGRGVMDTLFSGYGPLSGTIAPRGRGSLVAWEAGVSTTFGLKNAEGRGRLFIGPGTVVYEGMVVGEHQRPGDLNVNVCKAKHLTNMRSSTKDIEIRLSPPEEMSLDRSIEYLSDDELLEITPLSLRISKRILDNEERGKLAKRMKEPTG